MGVPTEPILDIMRRSMANLRFIEEHAGPHGPYEVTQLTNTFLGALAHPFEAMRDDLMALPLVEATAMGWPPITKEWTTDTEPSSLGDLVRLMRNGMAHGNIEFLPEGKAQIHANVAPRVKRRTWGAIARHAILVLFVELIERRHRDFGWYPRRAA
jgi:hypothetical protein